MSYGQLISSNADNRNGLTSQIQDWPLPLPGSNHDVAPPHDLLPSSTSYTITTRSEVPVFWEESPLARKLPSETALGYHELFDRINRKRPRLSAALPDFPHGAVGGFYVLAEPVSAEERLGISVARQLRAQIRQ